MLGNTLMSFFPNKVTIFLRVAAMVDYISICLVPGTIESEVSLKS